MLYEIKLKVNKENIKGEVKEVIEHYITNVEYFAEAEAKGLEQYNGNCDYSLSPARKSSRESTKRKKTSPSTKPR